MSCNNLDGWLRVIINLHLYRFSIKLPINGELQIDGGKVPSPDTPLSAQGPLDRALMLRLAFEAPPTALTQ